MTVVYTHKCERRADEVLNSENSAAALSEIDKLAICQHTRAPRPSYLLFEIIFFNHMQLFECRRVWFQIEMNTSDHFANRCASVRVETFLECLF